MKKLNLLKKMVKGAMPVVAAMALMVTSANVSTCCWFVMGQDELPENAKKLRRF